ncbi:phosphoribosyl-AMP cyclohydrolase [Brucellaceae bacterium C25G]
MSVKFQPQSEFTKHDIEEGSVFLPRFDSHGLITAVVCDANDNSILMVAHMNAQALSLTLETGIAHYWSRSRQKLWKKGETSGNMQTVVSLTTDCDQDALCLHVQVAGNGPTCHTERRSCFYREVNFVDGEARLDLKSE